MGSGAKGHAGIYFQDDFILFRVARLLVLCSYRNFSLGGLK